MNKLFKPLGFQVFVAETKLGEFGVRTYRHVQGHGWKSLMGTVFQRLSERLGWPYLRFVLWEEPRMLLKPHEVQAAVEHWPEAPWVSVLIDARGASVRELAWSLRSAELQLWPRTEVCVLYDAQQDLRFEECLQKFIQQHPYTRVQPAARDASAADGRAMLHHLRSGRWWIELRPGERLAPDFLSRALLHLQHQPELRWIYGDTDLWRYRWRRRPYRKPDWDPVRLLGQNYLQGALLSCCLLDLQESPYCRVLRDLREGLSAPQVLHLKGVGVHRRSHTPDALEAHEELEAVREHLRQLERPALVQALETQPAWRSVRPLLQPPLPQIAVIIPTRDRLDLLRPCLSGVLQQTNWPRLEVIVVDNDSQDPETQEYLEQLPRNDRRVQVLRVEGEFNYPRLNNLAVLRTQAEGVLLLNNDTRILQADWLQHMVAWLQWPQVGMVGAKLLYPSGSIQHAGVSLGVGLAQVAGHTAAHQPPDSNIGQGQLLLAREVQASTAACLLIRRALWEQLGGQELQLAQNFNDVDLCLRVRRLGWQILWTPDAVLEHQESASRGRDEYDPRKRERFNREALWMKQRWASQLIPPIEESPLHLHESPARPRDSGPPHPAQHAAADPNRFSDLVAK